MIPPHGVITSFAQVVDDNLQRLVGTVPGPKDTPYDGGVFKVGATGSSSPTGSLRRALDPFHNVGIQGPAPCPSACFACNTSSHPLTPSRLLTFFPSPCHPSLPTRFPSTPLSALPPCPQVDIHLEDQYLCGP